MAHSLSPTLTFSFNLFSNFAKPKFSSSDLSPFRGKSATGVPAIFHHKISGRSVLGKLAESGLLSKCFGNARKINLNNLL